MVLRVVVGVSWSLVTGLAGGWLLLSPWALGEQPGSGDWTTVTKTQFWTGAGLVALAVICLAMVASQLASAMRGGPATQTSGHRPRSAGSAQSGGGETDAALVALANALVADLNRQGTAPPAQHPQAAVPPQVAHPNGPPYQQPSVPQPPAPQAPQVPSAPQPPADPWRSGR